MKMVMMLKKLSIKLGIIFFIIIFGVQTGLFFFLHSSMVDSRIEEEMFALQARGNSHRDVLEKHFDTTTIHHVALMESEADTDVFITDSNNKVLDSSIEKTQFICMLTIPTNKISHSGEVIEANWRVEPYIATISPVEINDETVGYVYMFKNTDSLHSLITRLNEHFIIVGTLSIILTSIIILFLSKALTKPLIKMKEATSQISKGDFSVTLPKLGSDELGDLANSIQILANDLNHIKQERNEFLASISHELRTPLTYIKGYADILLKRDLSPEEQQKYLTIIVEESKHVSTLIKDLFDLAKLDHNSFLIQEQSVNLNIFFNSIADKMTLPFKAHGMKLTIECPPNTFIQADPIRLEQIIINLLDNSIKYSSAGTEATIIVTKKKADVLIRIKDNGKGIPLEDLPYIFNRFYRVDKSRSRALGGSGLGLSIVKELVQAQGGTITVKSEENVGTEFEIIFKGEDH